MTTGKIRGCIFKTMELYSGNRNNNQLNVVQSDSRTISNCNNLGKNVKPRQRQKTKHRDLENI